MHHIFRFILAAGLLLSTQAWAVSAISISALQGRITILRHGDSLSPKANDPIEVGDHVTVGALGWVMLKLSDGGSFTLRQGADFSFDGYHFSGRQVQPEDSVFVSLFKGSMRAITGLIGQTNHRNYAIKTPAATIGVRGTDHNVVIVGEGAGNAEDTPPGVYDQVNDGETVLTTDQGEVDIHKGETGSVPLFGGLPRLLDHIPKLLEKIDDEDLRNGIQDHLKAIHEMMNDGSFKNTLSGVQQLRDLRGKPNSGDERKKVINKMLDDMTKDE